MSPFVGVRDRRSGGTGAEVLATADWEGRMQPMVYVKRRGESRICYVALGHDAVVDHPAFRQLVVQDARQAAGVGS
ncbi:MAG: hypothetical protein COZ57_20645 [Armatimonadetes bacterium CG_4_8_14_3_um_filter_66_20]|nr:MAG: hypothetical protein COZ57_20645 [Armatimonadetes bacterium CG_4_8_14_3_um_filter_66_20]